MLGQLKRKWKIVLILLGIAVLSIFAVSKPKKVDILPVVLDKPSVEELSLTGVFTIVWNGEAKYQLTDNQGQNFELIIDINSLKELGGPLALDRKRVTISGTRTVGSQDKIAVKSVKLTED